MAAGFDERALVVDLRAWWDETVGIDDPFAAPKSPLGSILDLLPDVDSLATVAAIVVMERHLPFEVPPSVIRPGGYHGFDDLSKDMLPKLHALFAKHAKSPSKYLHEEHA